MWKLAAVTSRLCVRRGAIADQTSGCDAAERVYSTLRVFVYQIYIYYILILLHSQQNQIVLLHPQQSLTSIYMYATPLFEARTHACMLASVVYRQLCTYGNLILSVA
jgi:hypothetical protein